MSRTPRHTDLIFCHVVNNAQNKDRSWKETISGAECVLFHSGDIAAGANKISEGGRATHTGNMRNVQPSLSDFVIDVQNTARRLLSPKDYAYFIEVYFRRFIPVADDEHPKDWAEDGEDRYFEEFLNALPSRSRSAVAERDGKIREVLGAAFGERGIYPLHVYMNRARKEVRVATARKVVAA